MEKEFNFLVHKNIPFSIEGSFKIWATSKKKAKKIFQATYKDWIILEIKIKDQESLINNKEFNYERTT